MHKNIRRILPILLVLLMTTGWLQAQVLPNYPTEKEKGRMGEYLSRIFTRSAESSTPALPRTAAEWEEMHGIVISWEGYTTVLKEIVRYAVDEGLVYIVTLDSNSVKTSLSNANIALDSVRFVHTPSNSVWIRDYGPNNVYQESTDTLTFVDWVYNRPRPDDDLVPHALGQQLGIKVFETNSATEVLVATGGNFMTDGMGTAFSSKLILDENPGHPESEIDEIVQRYMGIDRYIKLENLPYDGIHHIDMHIKLLDEETLLVGQYPDGVADGPQIEANLQYILQNFTTPFGNPYRVIRIPMPPENGKYPHQYAAYRTYTNSLIINKSILVPTYEEKYDTTALRIYRDAMPGYRVLGIDCNAPIQAGGAIHCITHEIGADFPLLINHERLRTHENPVANYTVTAQIKHRSGIKSASLFYRTSDQTAYKQTAMQPNNLRADSWTAQMPAFTPESTIHYYIAAESNSGKEQQRPLTAPDGYYKFSNYRHNHPPVAHAGDDIHKMEEQTVNLSASASYDPNGDELFYDWTFPHIFGIDDNTAKTYSFTLPQVEADTTFTLTLKVYDGEKYSQNDTLLIFVKNNLMPVANAGADKWINETRTAYLDGKESYDPENYSLSYHWENSAGLTVDNPNQKIIAVETTEVDTDQQVEFYLTVNDGYQTSAADTVVLTIRNNQKPIAHAGDNQTVAPGTVVSLSGTNSTDAENDALSYIWKTPHTEITLETPDQQICSFIAPAVNGQQTFRIMLTVFDGIHYSATDTVLVAVSENATGMSPTLQTTELNVYPNPTRGRLKVEVNTKTDIPIYLEIYSSKYQKVLEENSRSNRTINLNLKNQPAGVYYLRIKTKNADLLRKIILN